MAELQDHQFELGGVVFGIHSRVTVEDGGFDTGSADWKTQDTAAAHEDALIFGEDLLTPPTWAFTMSTDEEDEASALEALAEIRKAWKADRVRRTPAAVEALRYRVGGRTRVVYGRPRRFSAPPDNKILGGYIPITADFQRADDLHYTDKVERLTLGLVPMTAGGFMVPFEFPLDVEYQGGQGRAGQFFVEGDADTWAKVTFTGPGSDFRAFIDGKYFAGIDGTVAYDRAVTIDPHPWARTVRNNVRTSLPGMLTRQTFMRNMKLSPGPHELTIEGKDPSGLGSVTIEWRGAFSTL